MDANVINELQNGLRRLNWRVLPGCRDGTPGVAGIEESIGEQNSYQYFA